MLQLSRRSVSMHYQAVNQRYSWQQNLMSNPTTRFDEIYNNVAPVAYTAATAQTFRIPLTALGTDLFSLQGGVWPGAFLSRCIMEVFWENPAYCLYAAGTVVGTLTLGYTVSGFNVQIVCVSDPNLDRLLSSRGCIIN